VRSQIVLVTAANQPSPILTRTLVETARLLRLDELSDHEAELPGG
jgi:hypothetical protein